jgi:hypothetical protein
MALSTMAPSARAQETPAPAATESAIAPPTRGKAYVQFGVAFTVEGVLSAGPICAVPDQPCILGSGGGISARVGWRPTEELYVGGAYEFSKQDPGLLYRLGILQQARAEIRRYIPTGRAVAPFVVVGAGLASYGDEWSVDTWGFAGALGAGIELELSGRSLIGVSLEYRPIYLRAFEDSSTLSHDAGVAHLLSLELALEVQDAL